MLYVWDHYMRVAGARRIAIIAHSYGGVVAVNTVRIKAYSINTGVKSQIIHGLIILTGKQVRCEIAVYRRLLDLVNSILVHKYKGL